MNAMSRGRRKVWRIQNAPTSSSSPVLWCTILVASGPKKRTQGSLAAGSTRLRLRSASMFLRMISIRSSRA